MTIIFPPEGGLQLGDDVGTDFDRCYQANGGELNDSFYEAARMFYVAGAMKAADSLRGQNIPIDPSQSWRSRQMLFGFPVVETDGAPVGEIIFGPFPTDSELYEMSRLTGKPYTIYDWIKDHPTEFCVVKNIVE